MSEIILNWLNDQIQLSKRITNFEQDFNNGFLLGQILSKYNQQLNFNEFSNKQIYHPQPFRDDKKSKIKNFQLLFDSLSALGVTFSSLVANQIINKKVGVAKKLLYQLKMHLQKTNSNAFTKITKMTKTLSPLKKLKISKQQYDKVDKQHFVKQLNELHPAQKTLNQQKLLKKFSDFHDHQNMTSQQMLERQKAIKLLEQKKFRQKQLDNIKKTADFRNQWEKSNVQKWNVNMTVRHMQNEKDNMFKTKLQQTKVQNKTMSELNAIKAMQKDLNQFERKFLKGNNKKKSASLIEDSDQEEDDYNNTAKNNNTNQEPSLTKKESKLASKLKFTSSNVNTSNLGQTSLKKKKLPPQVSQQQKHQRQKKRRKMIVQQNKRYQLIQISRRQKYILSTIQQTSKQQKQLEYEIWRVWQNKQIIKQNKQLVQDKQRDKNQTRQINAKFKRDQLLKTYRQQHQQQVKESIVRQQKLLQDKKVLDRKGVYEDCKKIIDKFIDVAEKCFLHQQQKNQNEIDEKFLQHLFNQFVQGVETKDQVAKLEVQNYVHGKGEWNLPVKRKAEDIPTDPTQDNALPNQVVNNYALGNILRLLYQNKYKQILNSNKKQIPNKINSQYVFSLLGLQFSGKHLAAQYLKTTHNFNVVQIQKLIFKKIQQYESIKDKVTEISQQTKDLVQLAYSGKNIPNQLIVKLISQEIAKNPKTILINFPTTYSQALQLTHTLSGVQPSDFVQTSVFQQKIKSFSRLVWPTQSKIVQRAIRECGVDLALWIDIDNKTSYDRSLGRRWIDGEGIVHISDDVAQKVNKLKVGQKATSQILKNYQKLIQKSKLQEFFNQFGTQFVTNLLNGQNEQQKEEIQEPKQQQVEQFRQNNIDSSPPQQIIPNPSSAGQQTQLVTTKDIQKKNLTKSVRKAWQTINGQGSIQDVQKRVLQILQQAMNAKRLKNQQLQLQKQNKQKQLLEKQVTQKFQQQLKQKCVISSPQAIKEKTQLALNSVALPLPFIEQLCSIWQSIQSSTIQSLTRVFSFIFRQQSQQQQYFSSTKRNFINLLTRQDKKFSIVKQFQIKYNQFFDQNKQMLSQDYTKQQLHQRVDDLEDLLFEIIQQKKQDAIDERKAIGESGWGESQLEQFYNCVRILIQAELNRYNASEKLISDFYSKRYAVPQITYEQGQTQIAYDTSLQMITKQGTFPRLQKMIAEATRLFNRQQQVVDDKNKKGGKAPPPAKKDDKKGGKKGQIEQVRQPTAQQLQMKRAINIQKSIFRYRLSVINQYSTRKISSLSKSNQQLSKDLQSYYQYTYQIQNKCVFNLSKIFRSKIQRQEKIQNQVQVNYVDIIQNEMIRNFEKQKPVILSAKQQLREDRFTIANILQIVQFIRNESEGLQKVSTRRLTYLLRHIKNNQNEKQLLPSAWKQLEQKQLEEFVTRLDSQNVGFIELWKIFIFFIMSNFPIPSQKQVTEYFNQLTTYGTERHIPKQKFLQTPSWFDQLYEQQQNVRTFNRNLHIKKILFDLIKMQKQGVQYLQAQSYMNSISLQWYWPQRTQQQRATYFSLAFD